MTLIKLPPFISGTVMETKQLWKKSIAVFSMSCFLFSTFAPRFAHGSWANSKVDKPHPSNLKTYAQTLKSLPVSGQEDSLPYIRPLLDAIENRLKFFGPYKSNDCYAVFAAYQGKCSRVVLEFEYGLPRKTRSVKKEDILNLEKSLGAALGTLRLQPGTFVPPGKELAPKPLLVLSELLAARLMQKLNVSVNLRQIRICGEHLSGEFIEIPGVSEGSIKDIFTQFADHKDGREAQIGVGGLMSFWEPILGTDVFNLEMRQAMERAETLGLCALLVCLLALRIGAVARNADQIDELTAKAQSLIKHIHHCFFNGTFLFLFSTLVHDLYTKFSNCSAFTFPQLESVVTPIILGEYNSSIYTDMAHLAGEEWQENFDNVIEIIQTIAEKLHLRVLDPVLEGWRDATITDQVQIKDLVRMLMLGFSGLGTCFAMNLHYGWNRHIYLEHPLSHGDVSFINEERMFPPLYAAAATGNLARVHELNFTSIEINRHQDFFHNKPLHAATRSGNIGMLLYLLSKGANPNVVNSWGSSPLHVAVIAGQLEAAKILISAGANINENNFFVQTPLTLAGRRGTQTGDWRLFDLLNSFHTLTDPPQNSDGAGLMDHWQSDLMLNPRREPARSKVERIENKGALTLFFLAAAKIRNDGIVDHKEWGEPSCAAVKKLMVGLYRGSFVFTEWFSALGELLPKSEGDQSVLKSELKSIIEDQGRMYFLKYLFCKEGKLIDASMSFFFRALDRLHGDQQNPNRKNLFKMIVRTYIFLGPDLAWQTHHAWNKIELRENAQDVSENKLIRVVKSLVMSGFDLNAVLLRVINDGDMDLAKILLTCGASARVVLFSAAKEGNLTVLKALMELGISQDIENDWGESAVELAAKNNHEEAVMLLINHGADLYSKTEKGDPTIHRSLIPLLPRLKRGELVKFLLTQDPFFWQELYAMQELLLETDLSRQRANLRAAMLQALENKISEDSLIRFLDDPKKNVDEGLAIRRQLQEQTAPAGSLLENEIQSGSAFDIEQ